MSAAAAQMSPGNLKTVPEKPPAPTAGAVLEQRASKERELAALESRIAETAYVAVVSGKAGALADLHAKILAARFELEANAKAHAFAIKADQAAVADWWAQVHSMPAEEAIEGISKTACCLRCSEANGCVISAAECCHPLKAGSNLNPRHQNRPEVRRLHMAAAKKLGVYR
jgi:hypothetical protein